LWKITDPSDTANQEWRYYTLQS